MGRATCRCASWTSSAAARILARLERRWLLRGEAGRQLESAVVLARHRRGVPGHPSVRGLEHSWNKSTFMRFAKPLALYGLLTLPRALPAVVYLGPYFTRAR